MRVLLFLASLDQQSKHHQCVSCFSCFKPSTINIVLAFFWTKKRVKLGGGGGLGEGGGGRRGWGGSRKARKARQALSLLSF